MQKVIAPLVGVALMACTMTAQTATPTAPATICKSVSGMSTETIIPASQAPNDPFGRVLGMFSGDFAGIATVSLTAVLTTPPAFSAPSGASSLMQVRHVFLTGQGTR